MWEPLMHRALALASLAQGRTSPNPLVGALVLDSSGRLIGEGYHARAGLPHAEVGALAQAGVAARGGTLIVSLEPCCHQGRTPPCTDAVIAAGIERVVVALEDPDPRVAGGGISRLRSAGLEVITGVLKAQAAHQNRAFVHRVRTGRPWGVLKWAMSLDGRTALPNGESQWISGPEARTWVHQFRACCDAVIVGGGTVRAMIRCSPAVAGVPPNRCGWCSVAAWSCRFRPSSGTRMWLPPWWLTVRRHAMVQRPVDLSCCPCLCVIRIT